MAEERAVVYAQHGIESAAQKTRLLLLQPGAPDDEIHCMLTVSSLHGAESTPFDALSYTWGGYDEKRSVIIHDCRFNATDNLFRALRQLRRRDVQRTLWIDALCINQDDMHERGQQVSIMDQIYKTADKVLVWLGDSNDTQAMGQHEWNESCQAKFESATQHTTPSWWQRAWTVQEYVLAKEQPHLCFGNCVHPVSEFFAYRSKSQQMMQFMPAGNVTSALSLNEDTRQTMAGGSPKPAMITLLQDLSKYAATNPRDYIYCLLGLMNPKEAGLITPDYTVEPEVVFARATYAAIVGSGSLEIMKRADWDGNVDALLPSWAIDPRPRRRTLRGTWGYPRHWPDCGPLWPNELPSSQASASLDTTSIRLTLQVDILGTVLSLMFRREDQKDHVYHPLHPLLRESSRWLNLHEQHKDWDNRDSWRHRVTTAGGDLFDSWQSQQSRPRGVNFWNRESGTLHDQGFTVFEISRSFICVAVGDFVVQRDDVVVLPHGCPFPMLVRPHKTEYKLVSFLHVHGIMQGELREDESDRLDTASIVLA